MFWFFLYLPSKNSLIKAKSELINVENQIREIEAVNGNDRTLDVTINLLRKKYQELNKRFPEKEEDGLRIISDSARRLNIEVLSLKPQPKIAFLGADNKAITIEGKNCRRLLVLIEMDCGYKDLVKYIADLKGTLPVFVTIEKLRINKADPLGIKLNVLMEMDLYLLS